MHFSDFLLKHVEQGRDLWSKYKQEKWKVNLYNKQNTKLFS